MLSELNGVVLSEYRDKRLKRLSPQSVKHELSMINRTLIKATEWGYSFPAEIPKVKYPTLPKGRDKRLSKHEEARLLSYCDPYLIDVIKVLQNTAMRIGELVKVSKNDINFDKKLATLSDTKNGDTRVIPLNSIAISSLTPIIKQSKGKELLSLKYSCISHRFTSACRKSGTEDYRLHDLRHEAISRLFERGFSIMEVSSISGHRSLASLKRYTHINPSSLLDRLG
jgi:integrase